MIGDILFLLLILFLAFYLIYICLRELGFFPQAWKKFPKDTILVYCHPPKENIVCGSPYDLKIQTFLRMAGMPYKVLDKQWYARDRCCVSINDIQINDGTLIIEYIKKKFKKNLNQDYSPDDLAIARSVRVMLENRYFWYQPSKSSWDKQQFHGLQFDNFRFKDRNCYITKGYGLSTYTKEDVINIMGDDLKAIAKILGTKSFILGDEPCEDDATIFGYLAQAVWIDKNSDSPFEEMLNGDELSNLKSYCIRMKEKFWADWDQCLRPIVTVN